MSAALALVPEVEDRQAAAVVDAVVELLARACLQDTRERYGSAPTGTRPKGLLREAADGREGR